MSRTDAEEERRRQTGEKGRTIFTPDWERTPNEKAVSAALEKVAGELGIQSITAVAIAYLLHKTPYVFPIIGGRKVEHLMQNVDALELSLSDEQITYLESIVPFDVGFPGWMIVSVSLYTERRNVLTLRRVMEPRPAGSWGRPATSTISRSSPPSALPRGNDMYAL